VEFDDGSVESFDFVEVLRSSVCVGVLRGLLSRLGLSYYWLGTDLI
jgi:hypothetical protein